jgi:hypothetical protein
LEFSENRVLFEKKFHLSEVLAGKADRVVTVETSRAEIFRIRNNPLEALKAEISQRIRGDIFSDFIKEMR